MLKVDFFLKTVLKLLTKFNETLIFSMTIVISHQRCSGAEGVGVASFHEGLVVPASGELTIYWTMNSTQQTA